MARTMGHPIRIPVSAIEPLPEPKPALPTTPGSVVLYSANFYVLDHEHWNCFDKAWKVSRMSALDYTVVFDAGTERKDS